MLSEKYLNLLSFPDVVVKEFYLDVSRKSLQINCIDGYLETAPEGTSIEEVFIEINQFQSLSIFEYRNDSLTPIFSYSQDFALKDICEFTYSNDRTSVKGFSRIRGLWTEFIVNGGVLEVSHR